MSNHRFVNIILYANFTHRLEDMHKIETNSHQYFYLYDFGVIIDNNMRDLEGNIIEAF